ncbi:hypothetical protein H310_11748 [Aphanomyces invadans]|uniref:Uncharacterized protein n=1 Tax=Aphanomyces invadans TaxID=157072 RepID=A0A024TK80_9STRA|nr:hypothetical protein H310_11748 [Aphanomyces invadans]ETV94423.1 hypothetical protein H310_11748 [Aphanomyces invadans]|eukprot:XP_008876738.1 hypothetical protein H310_11748 [Aphanomyces invadans]
MGTLVLVPHAAEMWKKAQIIQKASDKPAEVRYVADGDEYDPEDGYTALINRGRQHRGDNG